MGHSRIIQRKLWQHHGPGYRTGGFIATQHPHQLEGKLDGGARALAGDETMGIIPHHPGRAQLRGGQAGLKAGMAGGAGIPQQAVMRAVPRRGRRRWPRASGRAPPALSAGRWRAGCRGSLRCRAGHLARRWHRSRGWSARRDGNPPRLYPAGGARIWRAPVGQQEASTTSMPPRTRVSTMATVSISSDPGATKTNAVILHSLVAARDPGLSASL